MLFTNVLPTLVQPVQFVTTRFTVLGKMAFSIKLEREATAILVCGIGGFAFRMFLHDTLSLSSLGLYNLV